MSSRETLIETREQELDQLQTNLSLKRTRDLREEEIRLRTFTVMEVVYKDAKRNVKDFLKVNFKKKMFLLTAANSIISISNTKYKDQITHMDETQWDNFVKKNLSKELDLKPADCTDEIIKHITAQKQLCIDKGTFITYCTTLIPMAKTEEELRTYRIYGHLLELFAFRRKSLDRWRRMSEADIFKNIWCPILDIVFEGSSLVLVSGDTWSSGYKGLSVDQDERGAYKVDLRLILETSSPAAPKSVTSYDIANCEVAKDGKVDKKSSTDNGKLLVEGKMILDEIARECRFDFHDAKKIKVVNLQISGLKAILIQIRYSKDQHGYVSQTIGKTIMFPTAPTHFRTFFNVSLPHLYYWKERTEKNLTILQNGLNEDRSSFGAVAPPPCEQKFIKPTWLGPKTSKAKVIPPLPDLTF